MHRRGGGIGFGSSAITLLNVRSVALAGYGLTLLLFEELSHELVVLLRVLVLVLHTIVASCLHLLHLLPDRLLLLQLVKVLLVLAHC